MSAKSRRWNEKSLQMRCKSGAIKLQLKTNLGGDQLPSHVFRLDKCLFYILHRKLGIDSGSRRKYFGILDFTLRVFRVDDEIIGSVFGSASLLRHGKTSLSPVRTISALRPRQSSFDVRYSLSATTQHIWSCNLHYIFVKRYVGIRQWILYIGVSKGCFKYACNFHNFI